MCIGVLLIPKGALLVYIWLRLNPAKAVAFDNAEAKTKSIVRARATVKAMGKHGEWRKPPSGHDSGHCESRGEKNMATAMATALNRPSPMTNGLASAVAWLMKGMVIAMGMANAMANAMVKAKAMATYQIELDPIS